MFTSPSLQDIAVNKNASCLKKTRGIVLEMGLEPIRTLQSTGF